MALRCSLKLCRTGYISRLYSYVHVPKPVPPHLLGPGRLWRKCYEVYPYSEMGGVLQKYQYLTKTAVFGGLPEMFNSQVIPEEHLVQEISQRAAEFLIDRSQSVPPNSKFQNYEIADGFLQSFLVSLWQLSTKYPHLVHSHLARKPRIETYWRNNGVNYISFPKPMSLLLTTSPLKLFCDPDYTDQTDIPVPSFDYQPTHMRLFERSFDTIDVCGGCKRQGPYPFAHTLFLFDRTQNTPEQTHSHALMSMFAQTSAQTVQNGFKLDQDLVYPLSIQAILTDGHRFSFACYQLNTLDLRAESKSSRQNYLWLGPTLNFYEYVSFISNEVVGLNEEVMKYVSQFVLNKPFRKRPPHSGFMIDIQYKMATEKKRKLKRLEKLKDVRVTL